MEWGVNPCVEVQFDPSLIIDEKIQRKLAKKDIQTKIGDVFSGWAFCNLTTINAAKLKSLDDFLAAAKAATFIGTLQATYTSFPYRGCPRPSPSVMRFLACDDGDATRPR